jgi:hypothetical protein
MNTHLEFERLKKRKHVKTLPCLCIINPLAFLIVEIDASDIGYGGMLE